MDILLVNNVQMAGVVACLPENLIDNRTACAEMYGDGVDTLIKATGINARAVVNPGTTALDLGVTAAQEVMTKTNTDVSEIGAVICVTFTPEHLMPADAPSAQHRLGLAKNCVAFDVSMACSGYGYGLYLGAMLCSQLRKKVLVLDGDIQSAYCSKMDKGTMPVMADIGTATLLEYKENTTPWYFSFYTDGSQRDVLRIPAGGSKKPVQVEDLEYKKYEDGSKRRNVDIYMDGFGVFKFVAMNVSKFIKEFMSERQLTADVLDIFVPHQANIFMVGQLTKKLKIDGSKMWVSGDVYGNPSSGSVPLTIAHNASKWFAENKGNKTLLSGFGGGLSISVGEIDLNEGGYYAVVKYGG